MTFKSRARYEIVGEFAGYICHCYIDNKLVGSSDYYSRHSFALRYGMRWKKTTSQTIQKINREA